MNRRFQFSLRTLLIVTAIVALACALLAWRIDRKRQERELVAEIIKRGGTAFYDYQFDKSDKFIPDAKPPGAEWLRKTVGDNFFAEVVKVGVYRLPVTDSDLEKFKILTGLRELDLGDTPITDAGLANLNRMSRLKILLLEGADVTSAGVKSLQKSLPDCKTIYGPSWTSPDH